MATQITNARIFDKDVNEALPTTGNIIGDVYISNNGLVVVREESFTVNGWVDRGIANSAASIVDGHLESRMDDTTDPAWIYFGSAMTGSLNAAAVWVVFRMDTATNNVYYADGNSNYDNIWDDRATLTYSTGA